MLRIQKYPETFERGLSINNQKLRWVASVFFPRVPELCIFCSAIRVRYIMLENSSIMLLNVTQKFSIMPEIMLEKYSIMLT